MVSGDRESRYQEAISETNIPRRWCTASGPIYAASMDRPQAALASYDADESLAYEGLERRNIHEGRQEKHCGQQCNQYREAPFAE